MAGDIRNRLQQWLQSGEARLAPLTLSQRELWETSAAPVSDPANHICCLINLRGAIAPADCHTALCRVMERQEVLRLSFLPGKERPVQLIRAGATEPNMRFRALSESEGSPDAIEELAQASFQQPFDLLQGPLHRADVLTRSAEEHVIVLTIHHAIADGWSLGVFIRDLCGAYLQERMGVHDPLPPVECAYSAWGAMERAAWPAEELSRRASFWRPLLADRPALWDFSSPSQFGLRRTRFELPASVTSALRELARAQTVTLFSALLGLFQIALARWTGRDDFTVGTPVANRHKPATRETMGYFAGNVPLRGRVDSSRPVGEFLQQTHQGAVEAFAHAMPFVELVHALREKCAAGAHPIYQIRFALQNHPVPEISVPALSARLRMRSTGTARFDLGCEITEDEQSLEVVWLSRADAFAAEDIAELHGLFYSILEAACADSSSRIAALSA